MLGRMDLEAYTCWDFPNQSDGHPGAGDASFNGVTPARCAENLVRRYSRPGELVVDPMAGSGTIGDVARTLGRRALSLDLFPRRRTSSGPTHGPGRSETSAQLLWWSTRPIPTTSSTAGIRGASGGYPAGIRDS